MSLRDRLDAWRGRIRDRQHAGMIDVHEPDPQREAEWGLRARRDDEAMRHVVEATLAGDEVGIDVGAHTGAVIEWFLAAAPGARHVAIEPLARFAEHLRQHFPQVEVHECALGSAPGSARFFDVRDSPAWSGLHLQPAVAAGDVAEVEVAVERLDDVVEPDRRSRLVKIDVEGAELGVLQGASRVLTVDRPVLIVEHALVHIEDSGDGSPAVAFWDLLATAGYTLAPVFDPDQVLARRAFVRRCEQSHRSGYDRNAVTNWLAHPKP